MYNMNDHMSQTCAIAVLTLLSVHTTTKLSIH